MFKTDELPLLGILRGIVGNDIQPLIDICKKSGVKYLEITMNTKGAVDLIRSISTLVKDEFCIGAGTILGEKDLAEALLAGAKFIVTPSLNEAVIKSCVKQNIPVFPGAFTPTEVHKAWDMGATMVKLFPAGAFGPGYIRALRGPFDSIKLMAVGGVNEKNIGEYFKQGANAVAFGSGIIRPDWLEKQRYDLIEEHLKILVKSYSYSISS